MKGANSFIEDLILKKSHVKVLFSFPFDNETRVTRGIIIDGDEDGIIVVDDRTDLPRLIPLKQLIALIVTKKIGDDCNPIQSNSKPRKHRGANFSYSRWWKDYNVIEEAD